MSRDDLVLVTEGLDDAAMRWLRERTDARACDPNGAEFARLLPRARALVVRTYTNVDTALLDRAAALRLVARAGVGVDNIDVDACRSRGIEVVHTPDANSEAVVEFVVGALWDEIRPRVKVTAAIESTRWRALRAETVAARQISELTVGILGMGRIGRRLARVLAAYGCPVRYHDIQAIPPESRFGAEPVTAEELPRGADLVSVHVDGRAENRHLIDATWLAGLGDEAIFINASRGFIVDNHALAAFLADRPRALAIIDVHDPEPVDADNPLLARPNAVLYPHIAGRTGKAMRAMSWVVRDVVEVLQGRPARWPVGEGSRD